MVIQIVPLNIVKVVDLERNLCVITPTAVMALPKPGFKTLFRATFWTNADISYDESGMAMDILFKKSGRSNSTEQVTQNRTFCNPRINESAKSRLSDMYVVVSSCFHSILHLKT